MTKKLKWRMSTLPTPDEVRELVKDEILTKEEAREILFSSEDEITRDKKSLESEIKFLRDLVEKLSNGRSQIVETIKYVQKPYYHYDWYDQYKVWCTAGTTTVNLSGGGLNSLSSGTKTGFSGIATF